MALSLIYKSPFKILSNQSRMIRRMSMASCIVVHPRIEAALRNKAPIVALETAVLTHGMPFPFNVENALATESIVEREGAIPATIGVIKGRIHVGLDRAQIKFLADGNKDTVKVSRRDLPFVLAKNLSGGTTVSGTLVACHLTGIPLFVTGGIGGVHRGGERSLDVSSDLTELGKTSVAVVSAGVKSILDVGRTLEYLETQGVCVSVVGSSSKFPDFFTRDSGFEAPSFVSNCQEAAMVMLKRQVLNLSSGILFAVPIPEEFEGSGILLKKAIEQALQEAETQNVQGRAVTPFVLQRVNEITEGRSLITNMNLLKNNAMVGAQIAVAFSELENHHSTERESLQRKTDVPTPVVIGGSIVDLVTKITEDKIDMNGRTHRGRLTQSFGGVGRNIADALTRLQCHPLFISAVGEDRNGTSITNHTPQMNQIGFLKSKEMATASYNVLLDCNGEAIVGVGDMKIHESISPEWVKRFESHIQRCSLLILDGNVPSLTMKTVFQLCNQHNVPVWYEPTDVMKSIKPWNDSELKFWPQFSSPNLNEFVVMVQHLTADKKFHPSILDKSIHRDILTACHAFDWSKTISIMVTLGSSGFMIIRKFTDEEDAPLLLSRRIKQPDNGRLIGLLFKSDENLSSASVSGAGDCLAAGFISGMLQNQRVSECASRGLVCADLSLRHSEAVPEGLDSIVFKPKPLSYVVISD